jgi:predicted O-methyltransferase YrrM
VRRFLQQAMDSLWQDHCRKRLVRCDGVLGRRLEWGLLGDRPVRWRRALQERWNTPVPLLGSPAFFSRDLMWTVMMSQEDQHPYPNDRLLDLALAAAQVARRTDLTWLVDRSSAGERDFVNHWPGEHYRLLAACVEHLKPRLVVEIGTFTGLSALAMRSRLPEGGRVVTYDIAPWTTFLGTALMAEDLDGRLEQRLGDLSTPDFFASQVDTLDAADLVLLDGPKDGRFEPTFLQRYLPIFDGRDTVLVIDDTRFINMIQLWRDLPYPKLDVTSFGHWTGTGLVVSHGNQRQTQ